MYQVHAVKWVPQTDIPLDWEAAAWLDLGCKTITIKSGARPRPPSIEGSDKL